MYPTLSGIGRSNISGEGSTSSGPGPSGQFATARSNWPVALPTSKEAQNGPPVAAATSSSGFPMLRVHIADQYRTFPPVLINSVIEDIPKTTFSQDFTYEHQIFAKAKSDNQAQPKSSSADPVQAGVERFSKLGYSREEISLALAMIGDKNSSDDKIVEACKNYKELKSMGFATAEVVGALILHKMDLPAATEACLAVQ